MYYVYKQGDDNTNAKHLKNFNNFVAVVEYFSCNPFDDDVLVTHKKKIEVKLGHYPKIETEYKIIAR